MEMKVHAVMRCRYPSGELAEKLLETISPDNEGYVDSKVERSQLISESSSTSLMTMRSTLDDLLACLGTAERVILKDVETEMNKRRE